MSFKATTKENLPVDTQKIIKRESKYTIMKNNPLTKKDSKKTKKITKEEKPS